MDSSTKLNVSNQMDDSVENIRKCLENRSQCNQLVKKHRPTYPNLKNISWWDNQIRSEMSSMRINEITYKDIVTKRRTVRKMYHQSMTSLLTGSKSMHKISSNISGFYPDDLAGTFNKFVKLPKETARIWRKRPKTYRVNPVESYNKLEEEMKSTFLDSYDAHIVKVENEETNVEDLLTKLFSTDVDPFSLTNAVKVISKFHRCVPDLTIKKMGKPNMTQNDMITRLIHKDLRALKKKKYTVAFGKILGNQRTHANKYDFKTKYVNIGHPYTRLETFQAVFEDILELETTKRFCAWLTKNSHIEPPSYLLQTAALKPRLRFISYCQSSDNFFKTLEGYNDLIDPFQFYDLLNKRVSLFSNTSLDSTTSSSTLHSWDISDINIII